jgi:hypothetical protein
VRWTNAPSQCPIPAVADLWRITLLEKGLERLDAKGLRLINISIIILRLINISIIIHLMLSLQNIWPLHYMTHLSEWIASRTHKSRLAAHTSNLSATLISSISIASSWRGDAWPVTSTTRSHAASRKAQRCAAVQPESPKSRGGGSTAAAGCGGLRVVHAGKRRRRLLPVCGSTIGELHDWVW